MSTNGINSCEDAEMSDCDGDKVVTMMDVLKEQEDFEEDANAVLGASDDKNCTYSKGYVKRQAIYACMTCTDAKNDPTKRAGVCLACSLTCHENHELIELYTKRNFRCDCGNPKFNSHPCQFTPDKTDLNIENIYNQNFSGVYCTCHRPYPDPESSSEGDMIQCIICEDWLHCNHLDAVVPSNEQYSEMVCKACMDKNEFLHDYSDLTVNKESMDVDVLNSSEANTNCNENSTTEMTDNKENGDSNIDNSVNAQTENDTIVEEATNENEINKENFTTEMTDNKENGDSNIDNSVNAQTVNDTIVKEATNENEINKEDQKSKAEPVEDNEEKEEHSESVQTNSGEENICELETDKKSETEQSNESQPEDIKSLADTSNENKQSDDTNKKQSSLESSIEGKDTPTDKAEAPDSRSYEQEEEDLLLSDPMDTDSDQKKDAMDVVPPNDIQSCTDKLTEEKTSETDTMEISTKESKGDEATAEESGNIITSEQSENDTSNEHTVTGSETEKLEDATTTEKSESGLTENKAIIDNSEDTQTVDQSKTEPTSEKPENTPATEEPQNVSPNKLDEVSTNEQIDQLDNDAEKDVSVNETNITNEEKENSSDVVMNDNNTDEISSNIPKDKIENDSNCNNELLDKTIQTDVPKRKLSSDGDTENVEVKKQKLEDSKCVRPKGVKKVHNGATFWPSNFRHKLCTCNECLSMYRDLSVLFLIDPEDTVTAYEQLGKEKTDGKPASQYEKGMAALSSLGRVQQINALTEYGKLRDKLLDFLKTFKDKKVIVKEEDIKAFFAGMKPVREPDGVYFCR